MKINDIKTIDINGFEWFDRINGNSYFSSLITLNFGLNDEVVLKIPFSYGYGNHYEFKSFETITKFLNDEVTINDLNELCRNKKILLRSNKTENCLKRDLKI